jgi:hypothetical protein
MYKCTVKYKTSNLKTVREDRMTKHVPYTLTDEWSNGVNRDESAD